MKRRTTLGALMGALAASTGIGTAANQSNSQQAGEDSNSIPKPVKIDTAAVEQTQFHAQKIKQRVNSVNAAGINQNAAKHTEKNKQLLEKSKSSADNWEAFLAAREAAVNGATALGYAEAKEGGLTEDGILDKRSEVMQKLNQKSQSLERECRNNRSLVVLSEVQRSLEAGQNHLEQIPSLFASTERSQTQNLAQARGSIEAGLMNVQDAKLILRSNEATVTMSGGIPLSEKRQEIVTAAAELSQSTSYDTETLAADVHESATGYYKKATSLEEKDYEEAATISALRSVALHRVAEELTEITNPWNSDERLLASEVSSVKDAASHEIEQSYDNYSGNPLALVLLNTAEGYLDNGDRLLERAMSRQNAENREALLLARGEYEVAAALGNCLGPLLENWQ